MLAASIRPSTISLNAAMTACERCSRWQQALKLFDGHGIRPDMVSCNAAINCCEQGMQWPRVSTLLAAVAKMAPVTLSAERVIPGYH
jgi:hypothetical protein